MHHNPRRHHLLLNQHLGAVGGGGGGVAGFMHAGYWCAGHAVAAQAERRQAQLGQALDFACIAHAVLVGVLPDRKVGKLRVFCIEHAVVVAVKGLGQARQVGGGFALGSRDGVVLRKGELRVVVHLAIVVLVPDQHTVLRTGPAGGVMARPRLFVMARPKAVAIHMLAKR